jgi:quercetin dioxygenase-like cupin family protein
MKFPANFIVEKHIHDYDHISILASGKVGVYLDNIEEETIYTAPTAIVIEAGVEHTIYAIEDSVWFCIHNGSNSDEVEITENVQY